MPWPACCGRGTPGADAAADHIQVTDEALGQIPDEQRHGHPILVRSDGAGATKQWLNHLRGLRDEQGLQVSFSVGFTVTNQVKDAIALLPVRRARSRSTRPVSPARSTTPACRRLGRGADRAASRPHQRWLPVGMRVLVRRERPHPGAQISLMEAVDGWRYQCVATDTPTGQLAFLEARHRAHAHVEDRVKAVKQTGGRFPSREFAINQCAAAGDHRRRPDRLDPDHPPRRQSAHAEPKKLRYQLLHTAARIVRGQRKVRIRIDTSCRASEPAVRAPAHGSAIPSYLTGAEPLTIHDPRPRRTDTGRPISTPSQTRSTPAAGNYNHDHRLSKDGVSLDSPIGLIERVGVPVRRRRARGVGLAAHGSLVARARSFRRVWRGRA